MRKRKPTRKRESGRRLKVNPDDEAKRILAQFDPEDERPGFTRPIIKIIVHPSYVPAEICPYVLALLPASSHTYHNREQIFKHIETLLKKFVPPGRVRNEQGPDDREIDQYIWMMLDGPFIDMTGSGKPELRTVKNWKQAENLIKKKYPAWYNSRAEGKEPNWFRDHYNNSQRRKKQLYNNDLVLGGFGNMIEIRGGINGDVLLKGIEVQEVGLQNPEPKIKKKRRKKKAKK